MVGPECDEQIPDENELHLAPGVIRLGVVADLGWNVGKLIESPINFRCRALENPMRNSAALEERTGSYG